MKEYVCTICGYIYDPAVGDPDNGIAPERPLRKSRILGLPLCGVGKENFEEK